MKNRDETLFIEDIFLFCEHIGEYIDGVDKPQFLANRMLQDALVRKIEIIGEAVKNISVKTQKQYSDVQWKEIAGMRDKVIHHYSRVDLEEVWKTATKDMPKLKPQIEKILKNVSESEKSEAAERR